MELYMTIEARVSIYRGFKWCPSNWWSKVWCPSREKVARALPAYHGKVMERVSRFYSKKTSRIFWAGFPRLFWHVGHVSIAHIFFPQENLCQTQGEIYQLSPTVQPWSLHQNWEKTHGSVAGDSQHEIAFFCCCCLFLFRIHHLLCEKKRATTCYNPS